MGGEENLSEQIAGVGGEDGGDTHRNEGYERQNEVGVVFGEEFD